MNTQTKKQIVIQGGKTSCKLPTVRIGKTIQTEKWDALFYICMYSIVTLYNYDMPSIMETEIINHFKVTNTRYSLMYTLYSIPNIIFPLFGGYFVDKFGTSKLLVYASFLGIIGQFIVFLGAYTDWFNLMLLGRFLFGAGSEFLLVL
jgi:MFS family permease